MTHIREQYYVLRSTLTISFTCHRILTGNFDCFRGAIRSLCALLATVLDELDVAMGCLDFAVR